MKGHVASEVWVYGRTRGIGGLGLGDIRKHCDPRHSTEEMRNLAILPGTDVSPKKSNRRNTTIQT